MRVMAHAEAVTCTVAWSLWSACSQSEFETEAELNAVLVTEARLSANILASALLLSALEL